VLQAGLGDASAARSTLQRILDESEFAPEYMRGAIRPWVKRVRRGLALMDEGKPFS
jgi:hypothetical protein